MLTDAVIKQLKAPTSGQKDYADGSADSKGLAIRVSYGGSRSFYFKYRSPLDGKPTKMKLGDYPALPLKEAREIGRQYRGLTDRGIDPRDYEREQAKQRQQAARQALKEAEAQGQNTLATVAYGKRAPSDEDLTHGFRKAQKDGFLAHCRKANLRRWKERKRQFDVYVPSEWRDRQIDEITRDDLESLLQQIEADRGPVMANRVIETMRAMFNWLISNKRATDNPAANLQSDIPEVERDRILTDSELAAVWRAAERMSAPYPAFLRILLLTGQRRNEVATMRWRDLDLDAGTWEIPRDSSKMDRAHSVPLSPLAVETLKALPRFAAMDTDGFVFTTRQGATHISAYSKIKAKLDGLIAEAADKDEGARVDAWRIHDLRRTAASGMARLGVALHVIEKVLNHTGGSISGVAAIYNRHGYDAEKRQALEAWASHIGVITDERRKVVQFLNEERAV